MKKKSTIPKIDVVTSVENEIARLRKDPDVYLAKTFERVKNRRKQYLYQLRSLKKRGGELRECGVTLEFLQGIMNGDDLDEP